MTPSGRYPRFRAPQGDGEVLCLPSFEELPALVAHGDAPDRFAGIEWFGRSLAEIATLARMVILADASGWTRQYSDVAVPVAANQPLIVTGHQPELFHPGVWLKNFVAGRLAASCGGTAINLIIDSDVCRVPSIRVPKGNVAELRTENVPFDRALDEVPYEERQIADPSLWNSFGTRVTDTIQPLVDDPLIKDWWPQLLKSDHQSGNLGYELSRARHQLELRWGSRSLELPQSRVCLTDAFRLFALQLLSRAREFRSAFNESLVSYRREHRLKNHAQPVPDLTAQDGWFETPFWIWSTTKPQRRGLFVRERGADLELSDRGQFSAVLPLDPANAIDQFARWEAEGTKIRTRALATTLFARLLLADVFIHGIGGAKYDQVTDDLCESFFGLALPAYATVSGTLRLPIAPPEEQPIPTQQLRQELRDLQFHPERHRADMEVAAPELPAVEALMAAKQKWIHTVKTPLNAATRHQAITSTNYQLQSFLNTRKLFLEGRIAAAKKAAIAEQLRTSREYAYCLFPEAELQNFLQR